MAQPNRLGIQFPTGALSAFKYERWENKVEGHFASMGQAPSLRLRLSCKQSPLGPDLLRSGDNRNVLIS